MNGEVEVCGWIKSFLSDVHLCNIETIYNTNSRDPRIVPPLIDLKKQRQATEQARMIYQYTMNAKYFYFTNVPSVMDHLQRSLTRPDTLVETTVRYLHEKHERVFSESSVDLSEELPVDVRERLEEYGVARLRYIEYFEPLVYRYHPK